LKNKNGGGVSLKEFADYFTEKPVVHTGKTWKVMEGFITADTCSKSFIMKS
jgi:2-keto-3-deoxy-6-phosphogluconate aldolase